MLWPGYLHILDMTKFSFCRHTIRLIQMQGNSTLFDLTSFLCDLLPTQPSLYLTNRLFGRLNYLHISPLFIRPSAQKQNPCDTCSVQYHAIPAPKTLRTETRVVILTDYAQLVKISTIWLGESTVSGS